LADTVSGLDLASRFPELRSIDLADTEVTDEEIDRQSVILAQLLIEATALALGYSQ
jgi:hypothetical protein